MIAVVFRGGPEITLFKWSKCSILQLCNNYCPLIVPSSPKYSGNEKELLPAYVSRGVIQYSQRPPAVSEEVIWETFYSQG